MKTGNKILDAGKYFIDDHGRPTIGLTYEQWRAYRKPILRPVTRRYGEPLESYYRRYLAPRETPPNHVRIILL